MEIIHTSQTTEKFDTNIAAYDNLSPDEQRKFVEVMYEQETEQLPYRPETVLKVGGIALEVSMEPEQQNDEREQLEDSIDFDQYLAEAEQIIARLFMGDKSALSGLPPDFQEALSSRMEFRKKQMEDGAITEGEMQEELDKMCSVASVGLAMKYNPDAFKS